MQSNRMPRHAAAMLRESWACLTQASVSTYVKCDVANATACLGKLVCTTPGAKTSVMYTREAYRIRARTTPRIARRSCHTRQACVPHLVQAQFAVYATVVPHMCDDHTAHCAKKFVVLICSVSLARCWCSFSPGRTMYVLLVSRFVMQCRVLGDTSYSAPAPGILLRMV